MNLILHQMVSYIFSLLNLQRELNSRTPLQLVRSAPDGVTGRTVLRPDTFELMNEISLGTGRKFCGCGFCANSGYLPGWEGRDRVPGWQAECSVDTVCSTDEMGTIIQLV